MNVPRVAVRLYRLLLRVYPGEFTDTFGDEMLGVFLAGARHASAEGRARELPSVRAGRCPAGSAPGSLARLAAEGAGVDYSLVR